MIYDLIYTLMGTSSTPLCAKEVEEVYKYNTEVEAQNLFINCIALFAIKCLNENSLES